MPRTLRLILGDQLNYQHSWYRQVNPDITYLIMEMKQEAGYVLHHAQKIIGFFAAMFNFARFLEKQSHTVIHLKINDPENTQSLSGNLDYFIDKLKIEQFEFQLPDEYRLDAQLKKYCEHLHIPFNVCDSEHFLTERGELAKIFKGKKMCLMETFYRKMRMKHRILMNDQGEPEGGRWNFDAENREKYKGEVPLPKVWVKNYDYTDIWLEIQRAGVETFGEPMAVNFTWPTTRQDALAALDDFVRFRLPHFGRFQDAMAAGEWAMFHSRLSFSLNTKMLHPLEVVDAAIDAWRKRPDEISLASLEGFVRQIIGWREYMRGIYWAKMPQYATLNFFEHTNKLPDWFWTGNTRMNCLRHAIGQSLQYAYAHHIQRLMVTGNFALLAGIHPDEVDAWYLGIYIDAIEWVEITNTRGMSQFADGGIVGTKPYVSSANYLDKMSNYCEGCYYDKKAKTGPRACPFNSLYWHFYERNRGKLERNPRIGMMYRTWDKMNAESKKAILNRAEEVLTMLEQL